MNEKIDEQRWAHDLNNAKKMTVSAAGEEDNNSIADQAINVAKDQAKKQIKKTILNIVGPVIPWVLLGIASILLLLYIISAVAVLSGDGSSEEKKDFCSETTEADQKSAGINCK